MTYPRFLQLYLLHTPQPLNIFMTLSFPCVSSSTGNVVTNLIPRKWNGLGMRLGALPPPLRSSYMYITVCFFVLFYSSLQSEDHLRLQFSQPIRKFQLLSLSPLSANLHFFLYTHMYMCTHTHVFVLKVMWNQIVNSRYTKYMYIHLHGYTLTWLSHDCHMTHHDCHMTHLWLSHDVYSTENLLHVACDCHMTVTWLLCIQQKICSGKDCQVNKAEVTCYDSSCTAIQNGQPIRMCRDCLNKQHGEIDDHTHIFQGMSHSPQ